MGKLIDTIKKDSSLIRKLRETTVASNIWKILQEKFGNCENLMMIYNHPLISILIGIFEIVDENLLYINRFLIFEIENETPELYLVKYLLEHDLYYQDEGLYFLYVLFPLLNEKEFESIPDKKRNEFLSMVAEGNIIV